MNRIETGNGGKVVRFFARDNVRLNGILFYGPGAKKSCIIYIHGMAGSMFNGISLALAQKLSGNMALFTFNNRGHDIVSSTWKIKGKKRKRMLAGLRYEKFEESVYDIAGAIGALSKLGYKKFILCGHSTGCQKAIFYQNKTHDKRVSALILLGPADDYSLYRKELGNRYAKLAAECRRLMKRDKGNEVPDQKIGLSAQRLDSLLNLNRVEARLLNYSGDLKDFSKVSIPILAVFGSEEEFRLVPVKKYLEMLDVRSKSSRFRGLEILGANHGFDGKEAELAIEIYGWISKLSK